MAPEKSLEWGGLSKWTNDEAGRDSQFVGFLMRLSPLVCFQIQRATRDRS